MCDLKRNLGIGKCPLLDIEIALPPGLIARAMIEKLMSIQMVDVQVPTTDGRLLLLLRHTQPEREHLFLLQQLHLHLPAQAPPRLSLGTTGSMCEAAGF